jgi:hypothetical protein
MTPPISVSDVVVPEKLDLRQWLWPVENVGTLAACTASAAATALEYHCYRMKEPPTNLSTLFIHYNALRLNGQQNTNSGATMEAVMKAITTYGACAESTWPLNAAQATAAPSAQAYAEAKKFATVVTAHANDVLEAVGLGYPSPFVARIPMRCLTEAGRTGVFPALTAEELQRNGDHPAHAMVAVAYDKADRTFVLRNCFGEQWGDRGHCRISFDAFYSLVPKGSTSNWFIGTVAATSAAEPATVFTPRADPAPAPQPETLASLTAKMKADIRGDLQRDLLDATRRVRDLVTPPAPGQRQVGTRACTACNGSGKCSACGGGACASCGWTGVCPSCR